MKETRDLTAQERNLAWQVFRETIPYERVRISNGLGINDCPWMQEEDSYYILNMGPVGFPDATSSITMPHNGKKVRRVFIHELTHVWQAFNESKWVFTRSLATFVVTLGGDYDTSTGIKEGWKWSQFNVEQQASLVDEWFDLDKMSKTVPKWKFVNDNIRKRPRTFKPLEFKGVWEVTTNGKTYCYWLQDNDNCKWYFKKPTMLTHYAPYDGKGEWEVIDDELKIEWESGSKETWDLPLASKGPNGKWFTNSGPIHPVSVYLIQKL